MKVPTGDYDDFYGFYKPFVHAYVARRVERDSVSDVVAEVFTVTWRRRDIVPAEALPWLYRTARNLIGNRYRSAARLQALQEKLQAVPVEPAGDPALLATNRQRLLDAFAGLSDDDRELLLLVAWEGLAIADIAQVLEISPGAASVRLHRARTRFEDAMGTPTTDRPKSTDITAEVTAAREDRTGKEQ